MAVRIQQGRALAVLNLTPLIDVVFLLLIFFLVASRMSQEEHQLDIALPSAANAVPMTVEPQELIVNIDQQGRLLVDAKQMSLEDFDSMIRLLSVNNPTGNSVIIRGDRRVAFQAPIDVMNICLKYGVAYSASTAEEENKQ
jgi:biopolymer transport protein ExbD